MRGASLNNKGAMHEISRLCSQLCLLGCWLSCLRGVPCLDPMVMLACEIACWTFLVCPLHEKGPASIPAACTQDIGTCVAQKYCTVTCSAQVTRIGLGSGFQDSRMQRNRSQTL